MAAAVVAAAAVLYTNISALQMTSTLPELDALDMCARFIQLTSAYKHFSREEPAYFPVGRLTPSYQKQYNNAKQQKKHCLH